MQEITTAKAARRPVPALLRTGGEEVTVRPDAAWRARLQGDFELLGLRKLTLAARLEPARDGEVTLTGRLGATVVQPCVVTLDPVTTRIDADVARRYLPSLPEPEGDEVEMPEDDSLEPLGSVIDLAQVLAEALALNLPLYPRAPDAPEPPEDAPDEDGAEDPENTVKPFAALKRLKDRMDGDDTG